MTHGTPLTVALLDVRPRGYPEDSLRALLDAQPPQDAEFLILSVRPRQTRAAVESLEPRTVFADVQVADLPAGADAARARNLAIEQASTPHVLLLFSDALLSPGCIQTLQRFLDETPRAAAAGPMFLRENGWPGISTYTAPSLRAQFGRPRRFLRSINPRAVRYQRLRLEAAAACEADALVGACVLLRRGAWEEVGPYTSGYDFNIEEVEWAIRARQGNHRLFVVPGARAFHIAPKEKGSIRLPARIAYEESLLRCVRRTRNGPGFRLFRAARMLKALRLFLFWTGIRICLAGLSTKAAIRGPIWQRVLRWHLRGRPHQGDAGDCFSTQRWEFDLQ